MEQFAKFGCGCYSVNAFKARQDKFWLHQEVMFDFTADLSGTGNRSVVYCHSFLVRLALKL